MHSAWYRANSVLTYACTVLVAMCLAATASDLFHKSDPVVEVSYLGCEGLQLEFDHDRAYIVLNMTADLRGEFTWNTRQLFLFVAAEFAAEAHPRNAAVLWTAVLRRPADADLRVPLLRAGYPFAVTDRAAALRGAPFTVAVSWNVMPRVGRLYTRRREFGPFVLPAEYIKPEKGKIVPPGGGAAEGGEAVAAVAAA